MTLSQLDCHNQGSTIICDVMFSSRCMTLTWCRLPYLRSCWITWSHFKWRLILFTESTLQWLKNVLDWFHQQSRRWMTSAKGEHFLFDIRVILFKLFLPTKYSSSPAIKEGTFPALISGDIDSTADGWVLAAPHPWPCLWGDVSWGGGRGGGVTIATGPVVSDLSSLSLSSTLAQ